MKPVYLLCGVPGSGKTWVAMKLEDRFNYFENDDFIGRGDYGAELIRASRKSEKPILATCPFAERELKERLESNGVTVIPVFITEDPHVVKKRYEARELRSIPPQHLTRAVSIKKRAVDWCAIRGTASQVLDELKRVDHGPL